MLASTLLACSLVPLHAAPERSGDRVDADWILDRMVRPAPSRTAFVELRDSKLLKAPLRIVGEYSRLDEATLVRKVTAPYVETTTLRGGQATIERAGHASRRIALDKVPELEGLVAGFGALLAGDRAQLREQYGFASDGTNMNWTLVLTPKEEALASRVQSITLRGRGAELGCIETRTADDSVQRTLLAGMARRAAGLDVEALTVQAMAAMCRGEAPR